MKPSDLAVALQCCVDAKQPVIVWGEPGMGKSDISRQVAAALNRSHLDIRATLLDPTDLRGLPTVQSGRVIWCPPGFLPDGSTGPSLINFDEMNRAPVMTMNALLQLVLDRRCGEYRLPDNCAMMACCNRESDGGGVQRMPSALANRFIHLELESDLDDWCRWAVKAGIEPVVIAFLRFRPDLLHKFDRTAKAFPTERAWAFISAITARKPGNGIEHAIYAGTVGEGAAVEYSAFLRFFRELPSIDAILLNPGSAPVPSGPATLFAVSCALARRANAQNLARVLTYLERLPQEYAVYGIQDAVRRDASIQSTPDFTKWYVQHSDVLF